MPLDELLKYPPNFTPKRPTLENFSTLRELYSSSFVPFDRYLLNSLLVIPLMVMSLCLCVVLPSGVGFGLFKSFKRQKLLLLCFVLFLFTSDYITFIKLGIDNRYFVYVFKFLSSFEFLIAVFLVYLAVKLVFYNGAPRKSSILLGSFFVLSSFYAIGAIKGIWCSNGDSGIYNENLKLWSDISKYISAGGVARCGVAAANDILMLLATIIVVIVPLVLLLALYLLYRRNTNDLTKK